MTDEQTKAPRTMSAEREAEIREWHKAGAFTLGMAADLISELDAERAVSDALLKACKEWVEIDGPTVSLVEQRRRWHGVVDKMKAAIALAETRYE